MESISPLTYRIVAFADIRHFNTDECVDWAIEMIGSGYEAESMCVLAGLQKPTNYFETIEIFKTAVSELGLEFKTGESAIISICIYYIIQISRKLNVRNSLSEICGYCVGRESQPLFMEFCLLHWAWGDKGWPSDSQEYYPGATPENIEGIAIEAAVKWLVSNRQLLY
jgi:hypothetical protein